MDVFSRLQVQVEIPQPAPFALSTAWVRMARLADSAQARHYSSARRVIFQIVLNLLEYSIRAVTQ